MLSLRYRAGAKTALNRPIAALSRSVYQFAKSGHNPRTTVLLTDLKDDVTLKALKESVKDIKEIIGVELQPGCALHYIKQEDAAKTIDILTKMKYSVRSRVIFKCMLHFLFIFTHDVLFMFQGKTRKCVFTCFESCFG